MILMNTKIINKIINQKGKKTLIFPNFHNKELK